MHRLLHVPSTSVDGFLTLESKDMLSRRDWFIYKHRDGKSIVVLSELETTPTMRWSHATTGVKNNSIMLGRIELGDTNYTTLAFPKDVHLCAMTLQQFDAFIAECNEMRRMFNG